MNFKVSTENGRVPVTVLHVDGNIDSATYRELESKVAELIAAGTRHLLVDLGHSAFISSAGLRALHGIFNSLRTIHPDENLSDDELRKGISSGTYKSPHLKLLNLSKDARAAFEMGGFDMYIETFTDRAKAIAAF